MGVTLKRDKAGLWRDKGRDRLARARPSYGGDVTLSRRDKTVTRDRDIASPERRDITVGEVR